MRRRLVALSLAITSMVVIAFLVPIGLLVRELAVDRATTPAQLRAQSLAPIVGLGDERTIRAAVQAAQQSGAGTVHVMLPDGQPLSGTGEFPAVPRSTAGIYSLGDGSRVAVVPVITGVGAGAVAVTIPASQLGAGVPAAWSILGLLGIILVAGGAVVTDRLARNTTRALDDVEDGAAELSAGNLEHRVEVESPPEVQRIALALNELAARTTQLLASERERAADLSHGLRTPLTALRLDAEGLPDGPERDAVMGDVVALQEAVDRAIEQARRPVRHGPLVRSDLSTLVRQRCEWWSALAVDEGRDLGVRTPSGSCWVGIADADAAELVDALVQNVFSHTPAGTDLRVEVVALEEAWLLVVEDDGPGLPEGLDVQARGVSGGGSTGLGLSIATRIVTDAGGTISLQSGSSRIEIRLPEVPGPR